MRIFYDMSGSVRAKLICGDPAGALEKICGENISVSKIEIDEDNITVRFSVRALDAQTICSLSAKYGWEFTVISESGPKRYLRLLIRHWGLVLAVATLCALTLFLQTRVLFVRIEGNQNVPDALILQEAQNCGIRFGCERKAIRSQQLKDSLLNKIPSLRWAGIVTNGCIAVIRVEERLQTQNSSASDPLQCLVAAVDGIVTKITVTGGELLCSIGQAVKQGQVLVSAYTDRGLVLRAERAVGEIYAQTERTISCVFPQNWQSEGEITDREEKFSLLFGKRRINFYKTSRNPDTVCDKIYTQKFLTLPGGYTLPVALIRQVWCYGSCEDESICISESEIEQFATAYILDHTVAGSVMDRCMTVSNSDGIMHAQLIFYCTEMIAQAKHEELFEQHGNDS